MAYGIYIISTFVDSIRHRSPCHYCFSKWIPLTPTSWCKKLHFTSQQVRTTSNKPSPADSYQFTGSYQFTAKTPCNPPTPHQKKKASTLPKENASFSIHPSLPISLTESSRFNLPLHRTNLPNLRCILLNRTITGKLARMRNIVNRLFQP